MNTNRALLCSIGKKFYFPAKKYLVQMIISAEYLKYCFAKNLFKRTNGFFSLSISAILMQMNISIKIFFPKD